MAPKTVRLTALLSALLFSAGAIPLLDAQAISVALVKPWGGGVLGPVGAFWTDLEVNWATYGSTQVTIDRTTFATGTITAAVLAQSNPDVLFFADSSGYNGVFSLQEQADITAFLTSGGKRAIGTYLTFQYLAVDNRWLLPHFGLTPGIVLTSTPHLGQSASILNQTSPFVDSLPNPIPMSGYTESQTPMDTTWDSSDFSGDLIAASPNLMNIVHYYRAATHDALFISFMPEYGGNAIARQLVYNVITVPRPPSVSITPLAAPSIGTVLPLSLAAPEFPNAPYILGFSLSTIPGIPLLDGRIVPLTPDALFWFAAAPANGIFLHTTGILDGSGVANSWALISIPPQPSLVGTTVYSAMVTLDSTSLSGVGGISFPLSLTITN